ncbi:hypothetical protein L861_14135 [Litchfieldella anticariensis FP35 = DSM 16096]|uniref:MPN domain-containing protein n=1 Tax=Litchfieldella anticariensis (strain DSM 16096 / CECT 5854 / CIP 108499 / LMG 22089 / FP35) TaxID=1121939 RepID=S2KJ99_LITA3|nr:DNA repair protein RadC [Halomonas anticariensis]EPC00408.1 hypothetical protein L861_14135 [Halomonas anticariensis FP35 = DSM 16096]
MADIQTGAGYGTNLPVDASLFVRDTGGGYLAASPEQILQAARKVIDLRLSRGDSLTSPSLATDYLQAKLAGYDHEVFGAIFLDTQHRMIEYNELFHGTLDSASVYPREVVKVVLHHNAGAVIFTHNHPSGVPDPSEADKRITQRLMEVLDLIDVRVLDHIIVAGNDTLSFAEHGLI